MIALPWPGVVKLNPLEGGAAVLDAALVAGSAIGGLKLIQLRIPLRAKFSFRGFTVEIGSGAIVKSCLEINPHLRTRISFVLRWVGSFGQTQLNQNPFEKWKIGVGSGFATRR